MAANRVHAPAGGDSGAPAIGHAEREARLLEGLPDRGERERPSEFGRSSPRPREQLRLDGRIERAGDGHPAIPRFDRAAGKDELAGHEFMALVAFAHENADLAAPALDDDQRRGVARTERARFWREGGGRRLGRVRHGKSSSGVAVANWTLRSAGSSWRLRHASTKRSGLSALAPRSSSAKANSIAGPMR